MTRTQLPPFAISTRRYEDLVREALVLPGLTPERKARVNGYVRKIAGRTGEHVNRVAQRLG